MSRASLMSRVLSSESWVAILVSMRDLDASLTRGASPELTAALDACRALDHASFVRPVSGVLGVVADRFVDAVTHEWSAWFRAYVSSLEGSVVALAALAEFRPLALEAAFDDRSSRDWLTQVLAPIPVPSIPSGPSSSGPAPSAPAPVPRPTAVPSSVPAPPVAPLPPPFAPRPAPPPAAAPSFFSPAPGLFAPQAASSTAPQSLSDPSQWASAFLSVLYPRSRPALAPPCPPPRPPPRRSSRRPLIVTGSLSRVVRGGGHGFGAPRPRRSTLRPGCVSSTRRTCRETAGARALSRRSPGRSSP